MDNPVPNIFLTDRQIACAPFPIKPLRESQRLSSSRTVAIRPRTFKELKMWPNFLEGVIALTDSLNDELCLSDIRNHMVAPNIAHPADLQDEPSSVMSVQAALGEKMFPYITFLAKKLGYDMRYKVAGSGRSLGRTDIVIMDSTMPQRLDNLSERVFGVGEIKGTWQWEVTRQSYVEQIGDANKQKMLVEVTQQMYGDMVYEEAITGFISNYNQTVFFYRDNAESKELFFSPLVSIDDSPVAKFLYVLMFTQERKNLKRLLSRSAVKVTPGYGYLLHIPDAVTQTKSGRMSKRKQSSITAKARKKMHMSTVPMGLDNQVYGMYDVNEIPSYEFEEIGVTGVVIGLGKYGNVIEAVVDGLKLALKTFDACDELALKSFVAEQIAYHHLQPLQGECIPRLLFVGRIPHTSLVYVALTNEKGKSSVQSVICNKRSSERCQSSILNALAEIHNNGVLHGDVTISNMLWNKGKPYFIDFEYSQVGASVKALQEEMDDLEMLLEQASNG